MSMEKMCSSDVELGKQICCVIVHTQWWGLWNTAIKYGHGFWPFSIPKYCYQYIQYQFNPQTNENTLYSLLIVSSTFSTYLSQYGGKLSHAHIRLQWLLALESLNIRKPYVEAEDDSSCNDWKQRPSPSKSMRKVVSFISIEDGGPDGFLLDIRICQIENVMT